MSPMASTEFGPALVMSFTWVSNTGTGAQAPEPSSTAAYEMLALQEVALTTMPQMLTPLLLALLKSFSSFVLFVNASTIS